MLYALTQNKWDSFLSQTNPIVSARYGKKAAIGFTYQEEVVESEESEGSDEEEESYLTQV